MGGGASVAPIVNQISNNRGAMAGLTTDQWFDIGGKAGNAAFQYFGQRGANASNDRASELLNETMRGQQQLEREKLEEEKRQALITEAANKRNFDIAQEERLENLRRVEETEKMRDPARLGREQAYRAYMKKYYGYDTGPSVSRTPRTIADGTKAADLAAPVDDIGNPLSALTEYGGGVTPDANAYKPAAPTSTDPFMQGWTIQSQDVPYRRSLQRSAAEEV
jgi:hypothetical protein